LISKFLFIYFCEKKITFSFLSGLAHPLQYEPSLDNLPYTTLSYGNGPGYNLAGSRENLTNVDTGKYEVEKI
jgi:hypothetical protein